MKIKGIELMQMIANGKVNKNIMVNVDNYNKCSLGYVFEDGRNIFKWLDLDEDFEILEDKTEEIKECVIRHYNTPVEKEKYIEEKMNEIIKAVNIIKRHLQ